MRDLGAYYRHLSEWEGKPSIELISEWEPEKIEAIAGDLKEAFFSTDFRDNPLIVPIGTSNQSIGNKVADFFTDSINHHLRVFHVHACSGHGYPDKKLLWRRDRKCMCALELKATSKFDPNDSNRVVLTASSEKVRRHFSPPVHHLLATASYSMRQQELYVTNLRLDFLQPYTEVNGRLEGSVSQRLLSRGKHPNFSF